MRNKVCTWLLIGSMFLTASCDGEIGEERKNQAEGEETASFEVDAAAMDFPEGLTFDGDIRILCDAGIHVSAEELDDELNAMEVAKYKRTAAVEEIGRAHV